MTGSQLVDSAKHWSLDYLKDNIGNGNFNVYKSRSHHFKYYSDKKLQKTKEFTPPTQLTEMTFQEFVQLIQSKAENSEER